MESGEWRVESGEWRVESGEWRVESGECRGEITEEGIKRYILIFDSGTEERGMDESRKDLYKILLIGATNVGMLSFSRSTTRSPHHLLTLHSHFLPTPHSLSILLVCPSLSSHSPLLRRPLY